MLLCYTNNKRAYSPSIHPHQHQIRDWDDNNRRANKCVTLLLVEDIYGNIRTVKYLQIIWISNIKWIQSQHVLQGNWPAQCLPLAVDPCSIEEYWRRGESSREVRDGLSKQKEYWVCIEITSIRFIFSQTINRGTLIVASPIITIVPLPQPRRSAATRRGAEWPLGRLK